MPVKRHIRIDEDDTATYERIMSVPGEGGAEKTRVMETKRVDAAALVPPSGELFLLPPNCRFVRSEENITVFVTEDAPSVRTVRWMTAHSHYGRMKQDLLRAEAWKLWGESRQDFLRRLDEQIEFQLAFPYLVKCWQFTGSEFSAVTLWCRTKPLTSERDGLCVPNLPNRDSGSGKLCLTYDAKNLRSGCRSLAETLAFIDGEFWASAWNQDWVDLFLRYARRVPELSSPWEWERQTRMDPFFVLKMPWEGSDRTVGEEARMWLHRQTERSRAHFDLYLTRLRAADAWDGRRKPAESAHRWSPSETIVLRNGGVISVGDEIEATADIIPGFARGDIRRIEAFGRSEGNATRVIKFDGLDQPINCLIEGCLLSSMRVVARAELDLPVVDGVRVEAGGFVRFLPGATVERQMGYYRIQRANRVQRGAITVQLHGESFFTPIGEDGKLYPGIRLLPPDVGEANVTTLEDGNVLSKGDRFYVLSGGVVQRVIVVARIAAPSNTEVARQLHTACANVYRYEDEHGRLVPSFARLEGEPPRQVRLPGGKTLRIGDWFRQERVGCLRVVGFSHPLPGRGTCVESELRGSSRRWVQLLDANGSLANGLRPLPKLALDRDGAFLIDGLRFAKGERWHDLIAWRLRKADAYALGELGQVFLIEADGTRHEIVRDWEFLPFMRHAVTRVAVAKGLSLVRGLRLRCLAPQPGLPGAAARVLLVSHVEPGKPRPTVVLSDGTRFAATRANLAQFEAYARGAWRPLVREAGTGSAEIFHGQPRGAARYVTRWNAFRQSVVNDAAGKAVRIGDTVLVKGVEPFCHNSRNGLPAEALAKAGRPFTVVGAYRGEYNWVVLDAGRDIGSRLYRDDYGVTQLPERWREESRLMRRLAVVPAADCHLQP